MTNTRTNPLVRFMPSLTDVAFLMPIIFLFVRLKGAQSMLGDGDTGWHLRTGEWILQNGRVPDRDIFSFTKAGEPWYAWEWLWDVIFGWLHLHWGLAAVVLASTFLLATTFAVLYRLVRRKSDNVVIAIAVTFFAVAGSSIHWLARPHLFTLLFLVIFYSILERVRDGNTRLLFWLPGLTLLWTNLHGGFFVGIVLLCTYAAGELANWLIEPGQEARRAALARSKPYLLTAAACAAASFVNPYFYKLHVHIFKYLTDPYLFQHVNEFLPMTFRHGSGWYSEIMFFLGVLAAVWNLYRRRFVYTFLILGWGHLALMSARNIPLFLIVTAPVAAMTMHELLALLETAKIAGWLQRSLRSAESFAAEFTATDRLGRVPVASCAAALLLIALFRAAPAAPKFQSEYSPKDYPAKALAWLSQPECGKSVFTDDEWGDYLIYRLYPRTRVFVDGRSDFYGAKFSEKYLDVLNGKYDWEKTLEKYGVQTILLRVDSSLASTLKESPRWQPVYDDGIAIIFWSTAGYSEMARKFCGESAQLSAATRSGVFRDRQITALNNRDLTITIPYARR